MRRFLTVMSMLTLLSVSAVQELQAQQMPERRLVRRGNRQFEKGDYGRSASFYEQALRVAPASWEAGYNLGSADYRMERYDAAEKVLQQFAADTARTDSERAELFFNLGDVQFRQNNLKGALESFKNSLRLNPSDMEAKYNYAYVKRLLEEQENGGGGDNDQNDDQKDQKDDQNDQNDNQQQNDNNNDPRQEGNEPNDSGQDERNEQEEGGEQKPSSGSIPQEQLEAMLEAIQAQEDKTQEKVNEKEGVVVRGIKNW